MFAILTDTKVAADQSGPSTMQFVRRIIVWSFEVCMKRNWPAFDWNGESFLSTKTQHGGSEQDRAYVDNIHLLCFRLHWIWIIFAIPCRYAAVLIIDGAVLHMFFLQQDEYALDCAQPGGLGVGLNLFHVALECLHILDLGITQHICASIIYIYVCTCL